MTETVRVMIPEDEIDAKIRELGEKISADRDGKPLMMICILKGSCFFACELAKRITVPVTMDFMAVSSYGNKTESTGRVKILKDVDEPVLGRDVMIVEDIIDSGRTLSFLYDLFLRRGAASVKICTLLDKPARRAADVPVDYTGFVIPDEFVVGYGLDYAQRYRNLPFIGTLHFLEEVQ